MSLNTSLRCKFIKEWMHYASTVETFFICDIHIMGMKGLWMKQEREFVGIFIRHHISDNMALY